MIVLIWLNVIALALLPLRAFAVGAGVAPEKKQKEMEEAVARAANAPNADLTQIQCGNLVYAGNKSSICFADKFLTDVARETTLNVCRRKFQRDGSVIRPIWRARRFFWRPRPATTSWVRRS